MSPNPPTTAIARPGPFRRFLSRVASFWRGSPSTALARRPVVLEERANADIFFQQLFKSGTDPVFVRISAREDSAGILTSTIWTYACASLIARSVGSVPLKVMIDGEPAPADDDLVALLNTPAPNWTQARWLQASAYYSKLTGSSFWQMVRLRSRGRSERQGEAFRSRFKPAELWPYGEDSYTAQVASTGRPVVEWYTNSDGQREEPEDVIQVLEVKPGAGNEGEGLAATVAADGEIQTETAAAAWQRQSLNNRAVPAGIMRLIKSLSPAQYDEVEQRITDAWAGAMNAGKPMVLGPEVEWVSLAMSAVEIDFINGRKLTREGICASFGVPPVLVGILDRATYSNFAQAELAFWRFTVLPLIKAYTDSINSELAPEFGAGYTVEADLSGVDALIPMLADRVAIAKDLFAMGVPMSQINALLSLGLAEYQGWDVGLVASNLVPLTSITGADNG